MTPIFLFSLGHKHSYDSAYDSDSVASENQSLLCNLGKVTAKTKEKNRMKTYKNERQWYKDFL